ncbi:delta-type opioid receptor [Trichomycterus rosablanca]|uniref:delta-type opioid receptor n=1 Tax=Trichomycterus rosablanca TaxID=2290929 RepID=UPI002F35F1C5
MDVSNISGPGENISEVPGPSDVERVLVPILDTLILVTGLLGHALVILVLSRTIKGGRLGPAGSGAGTVRAAGSNVADVLLLGLSVADLLLLSCVPYNTVAIATRHWPFGDLMCKAVSFLGALSSSASAFTLAALACSRYVVVVHPTKAYSWRRNRRVGLATAAPWVPALLLAVPQFASRTLMPGTEIRSARKDLVCFNFLSEEDQLAYVVCHFVLAFVLPLALIVAAYGRIYHFLRRTRQNRTERTERLERYQAQVTHTSVLLVLAFVLCWMPSYGLMMVQLGYRSTVTGPLPRFGAFATFARVMATFSTVANPVLYVFMSQKFRTELQDLMRKWIRCSAGH